MASILSCRRYNVKVTVVTVDKQPTIVFLGDMVNGEITVKEDVGIVVFTLEDPALRFVNAPIQWANDRTLTVSRDSDTQITVYDLNSVQKGADPQKFGFFVSLIDGSTILSSGDPTIVNHDPTAPLLPIGEPCLEDDRTREVSEPLPS
jgi:hypothetical protein